MPALIGKSNSGKSWIMASMQVLCKICHTVPPGSSRFQYMDCLSKRLIVLNEPLMDDSGLELSKTILEVINRITDRCSRIIHDLPNAEEQTYDYEFVHKPGDDYYQTLIIDGKIVHICYPQILEDVRKYIVFMLMMFTPTLGERYPYSS